MRIATAMTLALLFAAPAVASPVEGDYCPDRREPVFVCDPFQQCWYECKPGERVDGPSATSAPGVGGEQPSATGNPGNAKNVGKAGEKGMDNESPRSGTKGRSGEKGGRKK